MTPPMPPWPARLRASLRPALGIAVVAAALFLAAVGLGLWQRGFGALPRTFVALAILALPPAVVAGLAAVAVDTLLPRLRTLGRAAAMLALLLAFGPPASAGVFSLQYRTTYPVDFQPIWTEVGLHQLAWTGIATLVLFAANGLRLFLPWAPLAALAVAAMYGRRRPAALRGMPQSAMDRLSDHSTPEQR